MLEESLVKAGEIFGWVLVHRMVAVETAPRRSWRPGTAARSCGKGAELLITEVHTLLPHIP